PATTIFRQRATSLRSATVFEGVAWGPSVTVAFAGIVGAKGRATMPTKPTLASARFQDQFHACAFVIGPTEEREVIDPFLVEGMRRGEKAVYIVDPAHREEHELRLGASAPSP